MRKLLIAAAAFIVSSVLGTLSLLIVAVAIAYVQMAIYRHPHPEHGIGAVAGGLSEAAVMFMPILCGVIGVLITLHRIERRRP